MTDKVQESSPPAEEPRKSKGLPTIAKIGIGCVVLLILLSVLIGFAGSYLFSKIGMGLAKQAIQEKTGVNIDTSGESVTFTDKETGAEVNVGSQKLPDDFPKEFPIYPGAKPTGSMAGGKNSTSGFWVVLTTQDSLEKVQAFYDSELETKDWTTTGTMTVANSTILTIKNSTYQGTVSLSTDTENNVTSIVVTLGASGSTSEATAGETPAE